MVYPVESFTGSEEAPKDKEVKFETIKKALLIIQLFAALILGPPALL